MTDFILLGDYLGIIISLIFFIIFFFTDGRLNKSRSLVMIGMFLFALTYFLDIFIRKGEWELAKIFALISLPAIFAVYPLLFHYLLNLLSNSEKVIIEKEKFIVPVIVFFLILGTYLFLDEAGIKTFILNNFLVSFSDLEFYSPVLILLIILYYVQASYFIYRFFKFQNRTHTIKSKIDKPAYLHRWVKYITFGVILIELLYLIIFLLPESADKVEMVISILFVIFLGIIGIKHNEILLSMRITNGFKQHNIVGISKRKRPSNISREEMRSILLDMDRIISTEKLYLDPNLKLKNLARKIHIPEKELSILINDHFKKNFSTYINNFRIEEAKCILEKEKNNYKLENLYAEVGFFTRSTFNRAFKFITNITPSEYQKNIFNS